MPLSPFTASGDLPPGIHCTTLSEVLERFGSGSSQRLLVGLRLERIYNIAWATGHACPLRSLRVVCHCQPGSQ